MKRVFIIICILTMIFILSSVAGAQVPLPPYTIGGTVTINGILKTQSTFNIYTIKVTKVGGTALVPAAETTSLLESGNYQVKIPVNDDSHTGGATPGETLEIHIYKGNRELSILSPANGQITMGDSGTTFSINIIAEGGGSLSGVLPLLLDE